MSSSLPYFFDEDNLPVYECTTSNGCGTGYACVGNKCVRVSTGVSNKPLIGGSGGSGGNFGDLTGGGDCGWNIDDKEYPEYPLPSICEGGALPPGVPGCGSANCGTGNGSGEQVPRPVYDEESGCLNPPTLNLPECCREIDREPYYKCDPTYCPEVPVPDLPDPEETPMPFPTPEPDTPRPDVPEVPAPWPGTPPALPPIPDLPPLPPLPEIPDPPLNTPDPNPDDPDGPKPGDPDFVCPPLDGPPADTGCSTFCTNYYSQFGEYGAGCGASNSCSSCEDCVERFVTLEPPTNYPVGCPQPPTYNYKRGVCEPKRVGKPCFCDGGRDCRECETCDRSPGSTFGDCVDSNDCVECSTIYNYPCSDGKTFTDAVCCEKSALAAGQCARSIAKSKCPPPPPPPTRCDTYTRSDAGPVPPRCDPGDRTLGVTSGGGYSYRICEHCEDEPPEKEIGCNCHDDCPACYRCVHDVAASKTVCRRSGLC